MTPSLRMTCSLFVHESTSTSTTLVFPAWSPRAAVLLAAVDDADAARRARECLNRTYLCRPQLLPNPRFDTPWQALYHSGSDRAFVTTMGVDVETFHHILENGFRLMWAIVPVAHCIGRRDRVQQWSRESCSHRSQPASQVKFQGPTTAIAILVNAVTCRTIKSRTII